MGDQKSNNRVENQVSQPQWLPNDFMVGKALEEGDCFFDALAQGMNLLSIPDGPFNVKSLRQSCSEYAKAHQDWDQVIAADAKTGGYATFGGQQADVDNYLVRIQLTAGEMSVLKIAGPAVRGRPNIEGCMLCQKYGIKLHLIEKCTTDSEEVFIHKLVDILGSRPISVDANVSLYNQPGIIHILNEGCTHFVPVLPTTIVCQEHIKKQGHLPLVESADSQQNQLDRITLHPDQSVAPVSGVRHSQQLLSLCEPSSPKRKLVKENAIETKWSLSLPEETETFEAMNAKSSLHGMAYQWKWLMLFACKSKQLGYDFRLATEMNAAEKFDDVVLQYVEEGSDVKHCRFLQAKHIQTVSESKKITGKELLEKEVGNFSLPKYFRSYQKIKRSELFQPGELQDFIICTNIDFDFDSGFQHQSLKKLYYREPLYLESVTEADKMLNVGGERYRLVSSSHPERQVVVSVLKSVFDKKSECRNLAKKQKSKDGELTGLPELQVTDEEVEEFLDHLIFAVNQPNENKLSELISNVLGQELNLSDGDLITSDFQSRMLDWLKEEQGSYQSEKTVGKYFSDLQEKVCQLILIGPTHEHVEILQKYGIQFNDNVLPAALKKFLDLSQPEGETSVFNYITDSEQTFLGSIKVNQVMKDISAYKTQGSFIFISLKKLLLLEEKTLMAFRQKQSKLLIVECKEKHADWIKTLPIKLSEIIKKSPGKKVIFIAPHNHPLASQFQTGELKPRYQEMVDEFQFGDLTSDSQKKLLGKKVKFQGIEIALNELMSAESAITQTLPLVSLIKEKELVIGQTVPVFNGNNEDFYIERTLNYQSDENPTSYSAENLDKLMLQTQHQKVLLISDTAGMGKTTLLTHLAKQIKQNFPCHWVVRIDLNDHRDALKAQDKQKIGAVEFLSQRLLKFEFPLEKELFEHCLKEGKVVLMLDGFDEICPRYERTVINLLQDLKETSVEQLWVTTRPHLRKTLEGNLQQFSYTLEPFSKDNQVDFLTKFWSQKFYLQGTSQQQLETYATALIEKLERSIRDRDKEFIGVPLQTRLLAEAFNQSDLSQHYLPDKLDLLDLFKRFTERKYDICQEGRMKIIVSTEAAKEQRAHDFKAVTEAHQHLALEVLFPKKVVEIFKDNSQPAFEDQHLSRYGIVQYIDNKPHFIHRTFAEYYVADFFINQLTKKTTPAQELQDFLLKDILKEESYQVIGSFLDGFVEKFNPSKGILEQSGERICELWKDDADGSIGQKPLRSAGRTILHQAAQEGHTHIIRYLLDSLKEGQHLETMHDLLLTKDSMGQTAWHLTAESGHEKSLEVLWAWAKEAKVNLKDDLLLAKDNNGQTAWHLAAWNNHPQVLNKLLNCAEAELSQRELKNLLRAKDTEGQTVWHLAAWKNRSAVFQNLMEWTKKANLNQQEFKVMFLVKDVWGRTPWHSATLNNHPEVYEWVTEAIKDPKEQKELLKQLFLDKDNDEQTIWHIAARSAHPDVFKKLLGVADKTLSKEELVQLLLTKDKMEQTAWHLSAENDRAESLNTLWEWAKKVPFNQNELKNNWLLSQDSRGTAWHLAAHRGHISVLRKLWDWAGEANLNLRDLLLARNVSGQTAWHLAAERGNIGTLEEIFNWAKEAKLKFADLLLAKDRKGQTPLELLQDCLFISEDMKTQVLQQWNCYLSDV